MLGNGKPVVTALRPPPSSKNDALPDFNPDFPAVPSFSTFGPPLHISIFIN